MAGRDEDHDELQVPFIFVPHGDPEPIAWMAAHPGWVKFPARFVPHAAPERADDDIVRVQAVVIAQTAVEMGPTFAGIGDAALATAEVLGGLVGASAVAGLTALGGALWPSGLNVGEVAPPRYPRRAASGDNPPGGFTPSPPLPPLPGSVPPSAPGDRPGEGGFSAHPEARTEPGSVPPVMPPLHLPGDVPQEQAAIIVENQRNDGLPTERKTYSWRVRKTLEQAGDKATKLLEKRDWVGHHLIDVQSIRDHPELFGPAARAGWRTDEAGNLVALPANEAAQGRLREQGIERPVQRGPHRDWNTDVSKQLDRLENDLDEAGLEKGTDAYNQEARKLIERLQHELREELKKYMKLTEGEAGEDGHVG